MTSDSGVCVTGSIMIRSKNTENERKLNHQRLDSVSRMSDIFGPSNLDFSHLPGYVDGLLPTPKLSCFVSCSDNKFFLHATCMQRIMVVVPIMSLSVLLFRVSFTASCVMDLRSFPHDSQTCHLKFGSCKYRTATSSFCFSYDG